MNTLTRGCTIKLKHLYAAGKLLFLSTALCFIFSPQVLSDPKIQVGIVIPEKEGGGGFWASLVPMMRAAADDLDIRLNVTYAMPNPYSFKKKGIELLEGPAKLDYFITGFWPECTQAHLDLAEVRGIKTLIINTPIPDQVRQEIGSPRTRYKQWIGDMAPDDLLIGYELADALIRQVRQSGYQSVIKVAGLGGNGDTYVDQQRLEGLRKRMNSGEQLVLADYVLAQWNRETAYNVTVKLTNKHPDLKVIWAASDNMALGAIGALKNAGKHPGKDYFVGGSDWQREALQAVARGEMAANIGGHFVEGTMALVLIHDYHHGKDFADELGVSWQTAMKLLTLENIDQYRKLTGDIDWSTVDFRRYSKVCNPELKRYNFSIEELLADVN
jgi:ABC-type sugar transport system substrate-binding protein